MSSEFVIEELGGFQRRVALRGYALPHWNQAQWSETTRTKKTDYAGNPDATIQVLGYTIDDTTIQGMWMSRKLPGFVSATLGAGEIQIATARDLTNLIRRIQRGGQQLRVQWEDVVRIEDVKWSLTFEWQKDGEIPSTPRAGGGQNAGTQGVQNALNTMQDRAAQVPARTNKTFYDRFREGLTTMRNGGLQFMRRVKAATSALQTPLNDINAAISISDEIREEGLSTVSGLLDVPVSAISTSNRFVDSLKAERWRRNTGYEIDRFNGEVNTQTGILRRKKIRKPIDTITVPQDTTLRSLSTR